MSLLDKFKNLFTDEEIVEVTKDIEIEPKKETPKLPKVMQEQIDELELTKQVIKPSNDKDDDILSDRELIKTKTKFNFPVSFDDEIVSSNKNVLSSRVAKNSGISSNQTSTPAKEIKPLYNMSAKELENTRKLYKDEKITKISKPNEKKFTRSPVISPVYGILDKNYKKEELRSKDENSYEIPRGNRKVDFESVHKKAFGSLADDIKDGLLCDDCELKKASLQFQKQESDDLLYDITIEKEKVEEKEKNEDNYENFGVSYEVEDSVKDVEPVKIEVEVENKTLEDDIISNVENEIPIEDCNNNEVVAEKIEVKEEKNKSKDNLELTDDLFNLIDSMYQDKEE